jgi:GAF domain-containing protein
LADIGENIPFRQALQTYLDGLAGVFAAKSASLSIHTDPAPNILRLPFSLAEHRSPWRSLQFTFAHAPHLLPSDLHLLSRLTGIVDGLLNMALAQEEIQTYATQSAFLALTARLLNERLTVPEMLDLALEQATMLLDAASSSIWLVSDDASQVESAVAFWLHQNPVQPVPIPQGKGVLGYAAQQETPIALDLEEPPSWFDVKYDSTWQKNGRYLLIAPLRYKKLLGFLLLQTNKAPYQSREVLLAQEAAASIALAHANATRFKSLREHSQKQYVLGQMSRDLTNQLEMEPVLNRAVSWLSRLCPSEYSLLWLVDDSQSKLRLAASSGLEQPSAVLDIGQGVIGQTAAAAQSPGTGKQQPTPEDMAWLQTYLHITARNLIAIPIIYQNLAIGVIVLINKIGGDFTKEDEMLLSTASQIAAISIGNANMYTRLLSLIEEREQLHRYAVQTARLAVVGRLTASLAHEINNPMQAIQGALSLALEERHDPEALREYIDLSQEQADRVVQIVGRLRQIYRTGEDALAAVDVNKILQEAIIVSHKELQRHKVHTKMALAAHLPPVWGSASQLRLAFLNLTLIICDANEKQSGEDLLLRSGADADQVWVEWETAVSPAAISSIRHALARDTPKETSFGLMLCLDIIVTHGGELRLLQDAEQLTLRVELPV